MFVGVCCRNPGLFVAYDLLRCKHFICIIASCIVKKPVYRCTLVMCAAQMLKSRRQIMRMLDDFSSLSATPERYKMIDKQNAMPKMY